MDLTVRYLITLRDIAGVPHESWVVDEGTTVETLLGLVLRRYGEMKKIFTDRHTGALLPRMRVLVNGRDVKFKQGLQTRLAQDDHVSLMPAMK